MLQANLEEEKLGGVGDQDGGRRSRTSNSPSRYRGFQRRLEEASAEVSAESATATQIVSTTARGDTAAAAATVERRRGSGGGGGGSGRRGWTVREDRVLERLVRECVFDFDLVAARISSSVADDDADDDRDGGELIKLQALPSCVCGHPQRLETDLVIRLTRLFPTQIRFPRGPKYNPTWHYRCRAKAASK